MGATGTVGENTELGEVIFIGRHANPGDIATPLLEKRPSPPPAEARAAMLRPEDLAACVLLVATLSPRAVVEEMTVQPR